MRLGVGESEAVKSGVEVAPGLSEGTVSGVMVWEGLGSGELVPALVLAVGEADAVAGSSVVVEVSVAVEVAEREGVSDGPAETEGSASFTGVVVDVAGGSSGASRGMTLAEGGRKKGTETAMMQNEKKLSVARERGERVMITPCDPLNR